MNRLKDSTRFAIYLFALIFLLILSFGLSLVVGSINLFSLEKELALSIFLSLRLPRSILVLLSGSLLAGAGCVFQMFFRNPLAEPGIMGVTSGATLGAVCSFLLPSTISLPFFGASITAFSFAGAILTGLLVYLLSQKSRKYSASSSIILTGTALGTLFSAITSIIILSRKNQLQSIYVWLLGSFAGKGWNELMFASVPALISYVLFGFCAGFLDLLSCGEKTSQSLGLNLDKSRLLVLIAGSLATATSVCCGGMIGFVGLISPHIIRRIYGVKAKQVLPLSILLGSSLLLLSDTLARVLLSPSELPVGIITSIIGAPIFIAILINKD